MRTRRKFSDDFKAKVALEALRGDLTVQEITARHKVHPNQVSTWKRQAVDGMSSLFSDKREKASSAKPMPQTGKRLGGFYRFRRGMDTHHIHPKNKPIHHKKYGFMNFGSDS